MSEVKKAEKKEIIEIEVGDKVSLTRDATYSHGVTLPTNLSTNEFRVRAVLNGGKKIDLDKPINGIVKRIHIKDVVKHGN